MDTCTPRPLAPSDSLEPEPQFPFTTMDLVRGTLIAVGTVSALIGAWLSAPEWAREPDRVVPRASSVVLILAATSTVALWLRSRHRQERYGAARTATVAGLAATVLIVWASAHLVTDLAEGYVDAAGPVVAGGAGAVLIGLVLTIPQLGLVSVRVFERRQSAGATLRGRTLAAGLALLLVAGLTFAGSTAASWPVRTSSAAPVTVAAVPQQVSQIGWTRSLPLYYAESLRYTWVVAGPGVVLITDGPDGPMVQALDGATGDTVWTYRRKGARILRLLASPDGRTIYVDSTMEGSWMSDFRVQAIDARTGELLGLGTGGDERLVRATTAGLLRQYHDDSLRSLSPDDMSEQWSWTAEPGCTFKTEPYPTVVAIVLVVECRDLEEMVGLAPDTGSEIWSRPGDGLSLLYADASVDLVVTRRDHHEDAPHQAFRVLDAATGATLSEIRSDHGLRVDRGLGCCAGVQDEPVPLDARTGLPLSPSIREVLREAERESGAESWDLSTAVLPGTLVVAGPATPGPDERRQVPIVVYPFGPAAEPVVLRAETPRAEELGLADVREGSHPVVAAGPGAVFVLAPTFPVEERHLGAGLTVIGLQ